MVALEKELIIQEVAGIRPGTFTRVCYKTELPVKACFKKQGVKVTKYVETTIRLGVNYGNIATVIARRAEQQLEETIQKTNNFEWVIKNKIRHNNSTGKDYLYVASCHEGHNTHAKYVVEVDNKTFVVNADEFYANEDFRNLIIESYFKKSATGGEVKNIAFENILKIGSKGKKLTDII